MKKFRNMALLALFAAAAVALSSCGNGGVPSAASSTTRIVGEVTDKDVAGATVKIISMKTGATLGTATTDSAGGYTVDVSLGSYSSDDVFFAVAEGGTVDGTDVSGFLKFKSIIGSQSDLSAAGADGTVNKSEIPDLSVNNVTTAKVALVEADEGVTIDVNQNLAAAIDAVIESEGEQEKENLGMIISIAASIKAVVDNPTGNNKDELGGKNIAQYVKDNIQFTNGAPEKKGTFSATLETAGAALEDDILADADLIQSAVGEAAETVATADLAGTWYGYHVDTWGDDKYFKGPRLMTVTAATSGGTCAAGQIYLAIGDANSTTNDTTCATLSGNVMNFVIEPNGTTEKIDVTGTASGNMIDGTFSVKDKTTGKALAGGIFKIGKTSVSLAGTYTFTGSYTVLFVNPAITGGNAEGDSNSISGSFTVDASGSITGTVTETGTTGQMTMTGKLEGTRVKAKLTSTGDTSTTFILFMLSDKDVTGLYGSFSGSVDSPQGDPVDAGKFKFDTLTKS